MDQPDIMRQEYYGKLAIKNEIKKNIFIVLSCYICKKYLLMDTNYTQWRVTGNNYKEIFDNVTEARRAYGRVRKKVRKEEEGRAELYGKTSHEGKWILLQEFELDSGKNEIKLTNELIEQIVKEKKWGNVKSLKEMADMGAKWNVKRNIVVFPAEFF